MCCVIVHCHVYKIVCFYLFMVQKEQTCCTQTSVIFYLFFRYVPSFIPPASRGRELEKKVAYECLMDANAK